LKNLPEEFHKSFESIQQWETLYLIKFGNKSAEAKDYAQENAIELIRGVSFMRFINSEEDELKFKVRIDPS
jgi:hypothetical protein